MGIKFKRQKPLGHFIVDFVCMERRLIIELDGGQHSEEVAYDQRRDAWLRSQSFKVLRFWNSDVMQQLGSVLEPIRLTLSPSPGPSGHPLPLAGEGLGERGKCRQVEIRHSHSDTCKKCTFNRCDP